MLRGGCLVKKPKAVMLSTDGAPMEIFGEVAG